MGKKLIKKRSEIAASDQWKLEDLFPTDEQWEQEYDKLMFLTEEMKKFPGTLSESGEQLYSFFKAKDELTYYLGRIVVYANERYHEDTAVSTYQGYAAKADRASTRVAEVIAFADPEILAIPEERMQILLEQKPQLSEYRRAMEEIIRFREHTLSAEEERLLARAGDLVSNPSNIFSMFQNADIRFPSIRDMEGNRIQVTSGNFVLLENNVDRRLRKQVYESLYHTYMKWGNTLSATYISQLKTDQFLADVSKYSGAREMYLNRSQIPETVYDNLIEVVHRHLPAMYRYVALRKKLLGVEQLHMYDVYVPIVEQTQHEYSFDEAKMLVEQALSPMGEEYLSVLRQGFEEGWIDIYENENKRSGAYSWGAYGTHPYVLLNFQGDLDSVFTLAHEMGHAIHTYYSNRSQPITYSDYRIFVAEVASTCNESLLTQYLLNHTENEKERLYLLNHYLESFKGTLYRQTMFAEFEQIVHKKQQQGEALTLESINQIYRDLVSLYFGPDMVVDEEISYEWMRIPHFYTPFYVYQYATGYSAAIAFSKKILGEGQEAVERYVHQFLCGGCSKAPIELLADAGVDMSTQQPIEDALEVFETYLNLFEQQIEK